MTPESVLRAVLADLARWAVRHPFLAVRVVLAAPLVCGGLLLAGVGMALHPEV